MAGLILYHGTSEELQGPLQEMSFLTEDYMTAWDFAERREGEPRIYAFLVDPDDYIFEQPEGLLPHWRNKYKATPVACLIPLDNAIVVIK